MGRRLKYQNQEKEIKVMADKIFAGVSLELYGFYIVFKKKSWILVN